MSIDSHKPDCSAYNCVVLKFGGSVLHSPSDFPLIAGEIQRFVDRKQKVVAVVSAYYGVTEKLLKKASRQGLDVESVEYAELIARGEFQSAEQLVNYLNENKFKATMRSPSSLDFIAKGNRSAATPVSLCGDKAIATLENYDVMVVPGFSAVDDKGQCVLLGRGGSDISAACIAEALNLKQVRLLKDVDGIYDRDPNTHSNAQRFAHVDYATAAEIAGELIQAEAISFAASRQISINVACMGTDYSSRIGPALSSQSLD